MTKKLSPEMTQAVGDLTEKQSHEALDVSELLADAFEEVMIKACSKGTFTAVQRAAALGCAMAVFEEMCARQTARELRLSPEAAKVQLREFRDVVDRFHGEMREANVDGPISEEDPKDNVIPFPTKRLLS